MTTSRSLINLWPQLPRLEWGWSTTHTTQEACRMAVTQAQGLAPGRYFIPATFPSLLSTNQTVTNPLDHKIQSSINTPWPPGARTLADKEQNTNQSQVLPDGARSHPPSSAPSNQQPGCSPAGPQRTRPQTSISPSPAGPSPWVWPVGWLPSGTENILGA